MAESVDRWPEFEDLSSVVSEYQRHHHHHHHHLHQGV